MTTHILEVAERMADRIGVIAGGPADRRRHARRAARPGRAERHRAWKTPSSRWSPSRPRPREPAATLAWFARHEFRLGWRDWLVDDDGRPPAARAHRRDRADRRSPPFMHLFAYVDRRRAMPTPTPAADAATLVVRHRLRAAVVVADDVAGDGIGDARLLCALRPRSHPVLAGLRAQSLRGAHRGASRSRPIAMAVLLAAPFINVLAWRGGARWLCGLWRRGRRWARWRPRSRSR